MGSELSLTATLRISGLLAALLSAVPAVWAGNIFGPSSGTGAATPQTIASVTVSPSFPSFVDGAADGTQVATATVAMLPPTPLFAGTLTINNAAFRFDAGANPLRINGTQHGPTYPGLIVTACQTISGSPVCVDSSSFTVTVSPAPPPAQMVDQVLLSNQQWDGSANATIGTISVTMSPTSPAANVTMTQSNPNFVLASCTASTCQLKSGPAALPTNTTYQVNGTVTPVDTSISAKPFSFAVTAIGAPGAAVTTFTFSNQTGSIYPAGSTVHFGQAFRRGDLPPGDCVRPRNAGPSHADLAYDINEIATRRENGDDNSIRHFSWWIRTDVAIGIGGTYTVEWVKTGAPCPAQTPRSPAAMKARLVAASHALKIAFSDVRNQDNTLRGTAGHNTLTFDVNAAFDNTGRDAPRSCGAGDVNDCWILSGAPKNDQGVADPLLYVNFYLDATSNADGTLGKLVHSALVHNSWMNVAAGSVGNSGAPGPAGLANDPQAVSYRPQLLDGATNQLDWSWWDQSVAAGANPVRTAGPAGGCATAMPYNANGDWTFPASTGKNSLMHTMAFLYTTAGTPPAGFAPSGTLVFVYANGIESGRVNGLPVTTNVHFTKTSWGCPYTGSWDASNQGSGTHVFSWRVWHIHNYAWATVDQNSAENVTASDGTRTAWALYPALTPTEQTYWKSTGVVVPVRNTAGLSDPTDTGGDIAFPVLSPLGRANAHFGNGPGIHNNLAQINEFSSQAFLGETKDLWDNALIQAGAYFGASWAAMLNERTGRIPAINNGPPAANHGGGGGSYAVMGAPFGNVGTGVSTNGSRSTLGNIEGIALALDNVPYDDFNNGAYRSGYTGLLDNSHFGSFNNGIYQIWGRQRDLAGMQQAANRAHVVGASGDSFGHQTYTVGGVRYYALFANCCEGRGAMNAWRDWTLAAALGGDDREERQYANDVLDENYWTQQAFDAFADGPSTNFRSLHTSPWQTFGGTDPYMDSYGAQAGYHNYAMTRSPLALYFLNRYMGIYSSACSDAPGDIPSFYCANFQYVSNMRDSRAVRTAGEHGANIGQYYVSDATERGLIVNYWLFPNDGSGRVCQLPPPIDYYMINDGDKVKAHFTGFDAPDELQSPTWYSVSQTEKNGLQGSTLCMRIINPATGAPFTSWTQNGAPYPPGGYGYLKVRPTGSRSTWAGSYASYVQDILFGLKALGFTGINAAVQTMSQRSVNQGFPAGFNDPGSTDTRDNWDPNITVP